MILGRFPITRMYQDVKNLFCVNVTCTQACVRQREKQTLGESCEEEYDLHWAVCSNEQTKFILK